jgi:uncharacterized protein (DUF2252 family)
LPVIANNQECEGEAKTLTVSAEERNKVLLRTRDLKMASSVHAFVRGNTAQFYQWLADLRESIPSGPPIWICGDCHLGNLGPVADVDGNIDIQIRDLDQTVTGNPAFDLIRLGLSLETAARSSDLPGVTTARMLEAMIEGYTAAFESSAKGPSLESEAVKTVRRQAAGRRWRDLAKERLEDVEPNIPLGKRFWKLDQAESKAVTELFEEPFVRERFFALADLDASGSIRVVDAAYWRKGCSSLGSLRVAALIGIRAKKASSDIYALIDIKEALPSVATAAANVSMPADPADRVVAGAQALSPNLGDRMIPAKLLSHSVVLRELAPQDLKLEIEQFSRKEAVASSRYLAYVVGRAHVRQMTDEQRESWYQLLTTQRDGNLDAPSWLWRSVVDLAARHEAGYLEHCRRFALAA